MNIREHDQDRSSHTDGYADVVSVSVPCLQEDQGEDDDTWDHPAIQQHNTRH